MNMKKALFLLIILLSPVLSAQENKQTIVLGKEWMQYGKDGGQYYSFRREKIVFNDLEYFLEFYKIYCYRQDGDKVYRCSVSDGKEQLILDYGLQVGDVFPLCEDFSLQVESISDTVITNLWQEGIQLKCLHLRGVEQPSYQDVWVESFGSARYGINPPTKAENFSHSHLMYVTSGSYCYFCEFNRKGVWGMIPLLGEEYPLIREEYIEEDPLEFTLRNDTLHIGGYIYNDCAGPLYMLVEEVGDKIKLSTYDLPEYADCYSFFKIDESIPGLTQDKYTITYRDQIFEVSQNLEQDPIAIDGKEWNIRAGHYTYFSDIRMRIEGDTIVDGITCKKLHTHTKQLWDGGEEIFEVGYCYQDGDKYYQNGELMFDLGLQVGDTFALDNSITYTVINVGDIVLKDGVPRKCLTVTDDADAQPDIYNSDVWIEGVGSLRMGIYSNDFVSAGQIKTLLSCLHNGLPIYYHDPIAADGKEWTFKTLDASPLEIRMWIDGDTIVDNRACKKIYKHTRVSDGQETLEVGFCWQDDKQYWQNDRLLFDFGIDRYDYFFGVDNNSEYASFRYVVESGDTILCDGLTRRYVIVSKEIDDDFPSPEDTDIWVEGIGSLKTGVFDYNMLAEGKEVELLTCTYNGVFLYKNDNTSIKNLPHTPEINDTPYYDLQGRPVANPTRGIYIKDGRKVILK